jgi:hypothetical protein
MRKNDWHLILAGVVVALAVIGLTALVVVRLSATAPVITAAVLVSVAGVLAAVPPIIKSIRGRW